MPAHEKAVLLNTDTATETNRNFNPDRLPKPELKWRRILRALLDGSLNRFNAERHGDHCLNSTVAGIKRDYAISIAWTWEDVPALGGTTTARVKRYWLDRDPANMAKAHQLLGVAC